MTTNIPIRYSRMAVMTLGIVALALSAIAGPAVAQTCNASNQKVANVVALDQPFFWNRLGTVQPQGMIFALKGDVINKSGNPNDPLTPGQVMLKPTKRPRPLVLRMNVGECLTVNFQNLLSLTKADEEQPATRWASVRVIGMQLITNIGHDGSYVGQNGNSLVAPGGIHPYTFYAEREGPHMLYSAGTTTGGEGDGGSLSDGLFGAVNVEPQSAEYYRSQVTAADLALAASQSPPLPDGHPKINYNACYPDGLDCATKPATAKPILKMFNGNKEIVHSDLTAIITGPNAGNITPTYPQVKVSPQRQKPFREFTIIYHDEIGAVQAFPQFEQTKGLAPNDVLKFTLHSVRDAFAINYGTGGIGAEILANRLKVGPMFDCTDCSFEEFFLSSWAVADPAMVVNVPANAPCTINQLRHPDDFGGCTPTPGRKAQKAFYPDDPSNVYHSYIGDHVKFRVLHGGSKEHHIHHLHAHQWLRTPDSDNSNYLDSQALGPGYSFTGEITYNGSGNRNQTVGDAIFHCHFYPHFAQGMWSLWRNHDVFEAGTALDEKGIPAPGSRALPDAEILAGTPIPAIVPMPKYPMAPLPQRQVSIVNGQVVLGAITALPGNPGYPFFVSAVAGHCPPGPPLDFAVDPNTGNRIDGGLPRNVIVGGTANEVHNRLSFQKVLVTANAEERPETGTPEEVAAMNFHAAASWPTLLPDGTAGSFITNGKPPVAGAPYAEPCKGDPITPNPTIRNITYKAAAIQFDLPLNKSGWHTPQARILTLWNDVGPTLAGTKPAEPLFFRANTWDCITYWHTNLMPRDYAQDDFQVLTPTPIIGQHIHLVKFDVTASDGAANGFNYMDGTNAPEETRSKIAAINAFGGLKQYNSNTRVNLTPKPHPFFTSPVYNGAQTTIQRWFVDDTLNVLGQDRTLQTVFTHDHLSPSTHQEVGLYAGLVVEKNNARWLNNENGTLLGNSPPGAPCGNALNCDGGPTSWQAVIQLPVATDSFREYLLEFADFQLAYYKPGGIEGGVPVADVKNAINPPAKREAALPVNLEKIPVNAPCPDGANSPPCPEAIAAADPGTMTVNYRNEPIALRVWDPVTRDQANGAAGDLSMAFRSNLTRQLPELNAPPSSWLVKPLSSGVLTGDPATPLLRAYQKDNVKVRVLVGAHEEGHNFSINGARWFFEPGVISSGWRNSQMMGISEHFEFEMPRFINPFGHSERPFGDFLYAPGSATDDLWNGLWGILRLYRDAQQNLITLPGNTQSFAATTPPSNVTTRVSVDLDAANDPDVPTTTQAANITPTDTSLADPTDIESDPGPASTAQAAAAGGDPAPITATGRIGIFEKGACPLSATTPFRIFDVTAILARDILPVEPVTGTRTLVYNNRNTIVNRIDPAAPPETQAGPLHDPTAIMFVRTIDLQPDPTRPGQLRLRPNLRAEPLILRANAGDCIAVVLRNFLPNNPPDLDGWNTLPLLLDDLGGTFDPFNANQLKPSKHVGLHPQLLTYNVHRSDGNNVGFNRISTAAPGGIQTYLWYAGVMSFSTNGTITFKPAEFGATNLVPSDRIKHTNKGGFGALMIEPQDATWTVDTDASPAPPDTGITRASATVKSAASGTFKEFVTIFQTDVNLRYKSGNAVKSVSDDDDPEDSAQKGVNYRTEPLWFRMGYLPQTPFEITRDQDFFDVLSNSKVGGDPVTPIFTATPNVATRFRVLNPGGHARNNVFTLHGHIWEEEPWVDNSGFNLDSNPLSEWKGAQYGNGATSHDNFLLKHGAGGKAGIQGDFLYRTFQSFQFDGGIWGLFRVQSSPQP
jgi:manganese oxidase